jgi:hypothetical protein
MTPLARHNAGFCRHPMKAAACFVHIPKTPLCLCSRLTPAVVAAITAPPLKLLPRLDEFVRSPLACGHPSPFARDDDIANRSANFAFQYSPAPRFRFSFRFIAVSVRTVKARPDAAMSH